MSESQLELDLKRDEVMRRALALRARLASTNPMWWLSGGVVAGALAARALPARGGRVSRLAPAVAIVGALEAWLATVAPTWLAQWRTRAAPEAEAAPPAGGPGGD